METLIKIAQLLLSLSLLIILHEFGHYIAARIFKTRVEKFYLFFDAWGKKLISFKKGETEYGIGWLPLGGYVKISGMIDESMDKEQMKLPPKPYEFRSKPAWQRLIIMLGGITVNFILGLFIYIMIANAWGEYYVGTKDIKQGFKTTQTFKDLGFRDGDKILKINNEVPFDVTNINKFLFLRTVTSVVVQHEDNSSETISIPQDIGQIMWQKGEVQPFVARVIPIVGSVSPNTPASRANLQEGDQITAINNNSIHYTYEVSQYIDSTAFALTFLRNGKEKTIKITPEYVQKHQRYLIGIGYDETKSVTLNHKEYNFSESLTIGSSKAYFALKDLISQFKYVFTKKGATEVGGFIAIGKIFPPTWSWKAFWSITAFLSMMLGFMNLLPIPALDGGHALFVLAEMITGRKPSDKFLEYAQIVGFVLLMTLLLWANGNDIYKLLFT